MKMFHRRLSQIEKSRRRDNLPALAMGKMCYHCGTIITIDDENPCGHHELLPDAMMQLVLQHVIGEDGEPVAPTPGCTRTIRITHEIGQNAG